MTGILRAFSTGVSRTVRILDLNGVPRTDVVWNTAGLVMQYRQEFDSVVPITLAELSTPDPSDVWLEGGFIHLANGYYRIDIPDAALVPAFGSGHVSVMGTVPNGVIIADQIQMDAAPASVDAINGELPPAINLQAMYDGTGYVEPTAPASRSQVDGISGVGGGAIYAAATGDNTLAPILGVPFVGSVGGGSLEATRANDGVYYQIDHSGGTIDIVIEFDNGRGVSTTALFNGYLTGNANQIPIQVYNHDLAQWDTVAELQGSNQANDVEITIPLIRAYTGSGAELGKTYVRFVAGVSASLYIDAILTSVLGAVNIGYEGGAVWLDTASPNVGTVPYLDGTADNPVGTIAAARALCDQLNVRRIQCAPGSGFVLDQAYEGFDFTGFDYTVTLNNESISGTRFTGANILGNDSGANAETAVFRGCEMNTNLLGLHLLVECGLSGTIVLAEPGTYHWIDCVSYIAGTGTPVLDFGGAVGNTNVNVRRYSGGMTVANMGDSGTDTMSLEGWGQFNESTCAGGTVVIRGHFELGTITNLTIVDDARYDVGQVFKGAQRQQMADGYAAAGVVPTPEQALMWIHQFLSDRINAGVTGTVRNVADSADAGTLTFDDANDPTSIRRTT